MVYIHLPDILWGFGEEWFGPLSSGAPARLLVPIRGSPPGRCPSAEPAGYPVPPPGADSRTEGRENLVLAPLQGSAVWLSCAGCGHLHPGGGSSLKNLVG